MSLLLAAVLVGLFFAYFAGQNTFTVPVQFGSYTLPAVPLYLVALGSLLLGLLLAWVISLISSLFSFFTLRGKDNEINVMRRNIRDLQRRLQEVETENNQLKKENRDISHRHEEHARPLERLRHRLST